MGLFASFMFKGFGSDQLYLYSPGTLYEVNAGLGVALKPADMRSKVETLLGGWASDEETFRELGQKVPVYALELHGINDKQSPNNGYGTYVYLPDEKNLTSIPGIKSAFSSPNELYDDEDPLKILSATYADENGYPNGEPGCPVIYDMKLRDADYYPIRYWERTDGSDPLDEIFGVFENLGPGEYGGISIVLAPPSREWFKSGRARIREIEDPDYIGNADNLKVSDWIHKVWHDDDLPGEGIDRMVYERQRIDDAEKAEIKEIKRKTENNIDHFRCTLRVYGSSDKITKTIADIITQKTGGKYNRIDIADKNGSLVKLAIREEGRYRFVLSAQEIPMIWHVVSDGGNGNSSKIHKAVPDAMIPPDELITIPIGAPGDIQKLIYSINESEKDRLIKQKVNNKDVAPKQAQEDSPNDNNQSDGSPQNDDAGVEPSYDDECILISDISDIESLFASPSSDDNGGKGISENDSSRINISKMKERNAQQAENDTQSDNKFIDVFDDFVTTISKQKQNANARRSHHAQQTVNTNRKSSAGNNPFADLEADLFGDSGE